MRKKNGTILRGQVSALKNTIGHLESAAGAAALLKVGSYMVVLARNLTSIHNAWKNMFISTQAVMCVRRRFLPAMAGYNKVNPRLSDVAARALRFGGWFGTEELGNHV